MPNTATYPRVHRTHVARGVADFLNRLFNDERHKIKKIQREMGWTEGKTRAVLGGRLAPSAGDLCYMIYLWGPDFVLEIIEAALDVEPQGDLRRRRVREILARLEPVLAKELENE